MAAAGLVAFLLALAATALLRRLAPRLGLVDNPGTRKLQAAPMPLGGGIAVAAALAGGWACLRWFPGALGDGALVQGLESRLPDLAWVAAGAALVFAMGLFDDFRDLGPAAKLAVQAAAAALVAFRVPESRISALSGDPALRVSVTVLWIVGITNAFNFLDNMDGLCAGVAAIAAAVLAALGASTGHALMGAYFMALLGALAGFLVFNLPPASIFLGDAGSQLIGFLLAVGATLFTYDEAPRSLAPLAVPLLVFGVPIFDAVTVVGIRLREGRSVARGDRSHFSHRLVALGMSPREAVGTIWLLSFVVGMGALLLYHLPPEGIHLLLLQAVGAFAIVGLLERAARRKR